MTIEEMLAPYEFDTEDYSFVISGLVKLKIEPPFYSEIVSGCYAAALRFLRCVDASSTFSKSIVEKGDAPPFPERAFQDQALFDFFINGLSAIESFELFVARTCSSTRQNWNAVDGREKNTTYHSNNSAENVLKTIPRGTQ